MKVSQVQQNERITYAKKKPEVHNNTYYYLKVHKKYKAVNKVHKLTTNAQKSHTNCTKNAMAVKYAISNVMAGQ